MKFLKAFFVFFIVSSTLSAAHISSASITYKCLGNEMYEFEMVIFRDCQGGGANFDIEATIGVYLGNQYLNDFLTPIATRDTIEIDSYANCDLNPNAYCIERASYKFELNLPLAAENYFVYYSRCCWAGSVANLLEPMINGISVISQLTPLAQTECNSQDVSTFSFSRPLCANAPFDMSLPTLDSEGDSLAYKLCLPYKGGGYEGGSGGGNPNACDGLTPSPVNCPPTFEPVELLPGFTAENPFPTENGFMVNNQTGELSFTPTVQGTFLFGLCVEEYRNGQLLSSKQINMAKWDEIMTSTEEALEEAWSLGSSSSHHLQLKSTTSFDQDLKVQLIDFNGRSIGTQVNLGSGSIDLNFNYLPNGLYFVKVLGREINQSIKVFIP